MRTRPLTTSWAVPSDCGFSSTGFMSLSGGTPQARACSAWARPISPPSCVTAALFDMFCGLNGRTLRPRRVSARQSPATMSDLPTSEPVPCSITAGMRPPIVRLFGKRVPQRVGGGVLRRLLQHDRGRRQLLAVIGLAVGGARLDERAFEGDAGIGAFRL